MNGQSRIFDLDWDFRTEAQIIAVTTWKCIHIFIRHYMVSETLMADGIAVCMEAFEVLC